MRFSHPEWNLAAIEREEKRDIGGESRLDDVPTCVSNVLAIVSICSKRTDRDARYIPSPKRAREIVDIRTAVSSGW
jgi:hypothetical protein